MEKFQSFQKINYHGSKIIYIPKGTCLVLGLSPQTKIAVELMVNDNNIHFPSNVILHITKTGESLSFHVPKEIKDKLPNSFDIRITKLDYLEGYNIIYQNQIKRFSTRNKFLITSWIENDKAIIWAKIKRPIIVNYPLLITKDLLIYLGLYFCDGNKSSAYRVYSSTREIYPLVWHYYHKLIKNENLTIKLRYDKFNQDLRRDKEIIKEIQDHWSKVIPKIQKIPIEISTRRPEAKKISNSHLKWGCAYVYDGRDLVREYHLFLFKELLSLLSKEDLKLFLIGAGLGDMYTSLRPRNSAHNWLEIATNHLEIETWIEICRKLDLNFYPIIKEGKRAILRINGYYIVIDLLEQGLFKGYTQRKRKCIKGMKNRIETYVLYNLSHYPQGLEKKGKFIQKTSSLLYVQKGGDLKKFGLISIDKDKIYLSPKGEEFINRLLKIGI